MKKVFLSLFALVAITAGMSSCKKCGKCENAGVTTISETCEKDSKTVYDLAKSTCEASGGTWKD